MLQATNLTKKIGDKIIIKDISLVLQRGEIVSIIGPSGAGKTTLLRAIALVDFSNAGSLIINEHHYKFPIKTAERIIFPYPRLTMVFQQLCLWPHLTIKQNITLPLKGMIDEKHFTNMLELFKLNTLLERYPNEISMGERQRTALVRALLLKPAYLLLDEITSALDIEQAYHILSHLKQIASQGVGIIFVSHALHLVSKISSKIIFLDQGSVVEEGTSIILSYPKTERLKQFINISQQVI
ncbi:MAG: ATP-binding cassette domain-containing protein [Patescibacteria group bacterium]|jgi:ABC-type polar amino acid transport system ATPase subunit